MALVLVVDVLDPGEERRERVDRVSRFRPASYEVLEVIRDVVERDLLVTALGPKAIHPVHVHRRLRSRSIT